MFGTKKEPTKTGADEDRLQKMVRLQFDPKRHWVSPNAEALLKKWEKHRDRRELP